MGLELDIYNIGEFPVVIGDAMGYLKVILLGIFCDRDRKNL
ncbi:hypothetical protein [Coleofasciculus sp. H7-2]